MRLAVTTVRDPSPADLEAARAGALRHALPFAPRGDEPLARVAAGCGAEALLVLGRATAALYAEGVEHVWTAGMAALRVRRLVAGERGAERTRDGFLDAAALAPGDAVLDATLGLGADALVAAAAVGPGGRVVGVEVSPALAALVSEGLARHASDAARRVEVVAGDAVAYLRALPPKSFDVVAFDPMFRRARRAGPGFDLVRRLGDARPLHADAVGAARRVARRWVVVKDAAPGRDLARLGLAPLPCSRWAERVYARVGPA